MSDRLNPEDWLKAARTALSRQGVEGVRVELLARQLKVTKGSFYWHFADRAALLATILEGWERSTTLDVIDGIEQAPGSPADKLRRLGDLTFGRRGRLEHAIRAWASHDASAARVVRRVDSTRLEYVAGLLEAHGLSTQAARHRARLLYTTLIGEQQLSDGSNTEQQKEAARQTLALLLDAPEPAETARD